MQPLDLIVLIASLLLLAASAEVLVRGAVQAARRFGLSSFFIGLTIVGFGTSTPELLTSVAAALRGQPDLAVGNVVGSNIFNIAVILAMTALICPIPVRLASVRREVWLVIASGATPWIALVSSGVISRPAGALLFAILVVALTASYRTSRREGRAQLAELDTVGAPIPTPSMLVAAALIVLGLIGLIGGAHLLVESASSIARALGVSELVIGLTVVSAGTSAPELVTSIVAALRKQPEVAIGNVLGSNAFNTFGILGFTSVVAPPAVAPQVLWLDTPIMFVASLALLPIIGSGSRISRTEGGLLLAAYVGYVVVLVTLAPTWFR